MSKKNPAPFTGEIMQCMKCKRVQKSTWQLESMWTALEVDGLLYYVCPQCWGIPPHLIPEESKIKK